MNKSLTVVTKGVDVGQKVAVRMAADKSADRSIVSQAADDALFVQ